MSTSWRAVELDGYAYIVDSNDNTIAEVESLTIARRLVNCIEFCQNIPNQDLLNGRLDQERRHNKTIIQGLRDQISKTNKKLARANKESTREMENFKETGDMWDESWRKNG